MKQIMKQLAAAACLLTTVCMAANAQQRSHLQSAIGYINGEVHIKGEILSSRHEQGRDQIDSLYYVREETLTFPYKSKKDKKAANEYIQEIVMGYQNDVNNAYSAFAFNADLEAQVTTERTISIFYSDNNPTYLVGKDGHRYVVIRKNSPQNPEYRNVYGVEWWLDKRQKRICFKCFDIFGPLHSPSAVAKSKPNLKDRFRQPRVEDIFQDLISLINSDSIDFQQLSTDIQGMQVRTNNVYSDNLITEIHTLGSMYKNGSSATDKAIIRSINIRVQNLIFKPNVDNNQRINLFKELDAIPGYGVEIIRSNGDVSANMLPNKEVSTDKERITFGELATRYPTLDIFCMSWMDETDLYVRSLDKKYQNGVLQIVLN